MVVVAGEFHTSPPVLFQTIKEETPDIIRQVLRDTGYSRDFPGIDPDTCEIRLILNQQSGDIRQGVVTGGAGDQGLVFGYATEETPELMPLPITLAYKLVQRQAELRASGAIHWLRPDAKSQVTIRYEDDKPVGVDTVVLSTQHDEDVSIDTVRKVVGEQIIRAVIPNADLKIHINPTGRFVVGGPHGDTGLTGRKIIVDTYGGRCPHGGGAFSGKDPSKVDRSAAYAARYVAKNIVAAGLANRCTVQIAYAIGVAEPVSVMVDHPWGRNRQRESNYGRF
nr:methionine adenosyltransferase [Desulfopila sp. IMCC35008]